ncbi:MAG TPA: hypothetical protein VMT19_08480 [Thermoanaerobaculaceae bacterium]|nr:hypothetical protein [Thermoanaerobaculaceae bacterium]
MSRRSGLPSWLVGALLALAAVPPLGAQDAPEQGTASPPKFRLTIETKLNARDSSAQEYRIDYPFPPSWIPPGEDGLYERTPAAGQSLELSNVAVEADGDLTPGIHGRVRVHFLDLYNRNPTSSDDRIFVREAWLLMGHRWDALQPMPGSSVYLLVGKAPRFTKQVERNLESYGLWGTAVARFEEAQAQLGGSLGRHVYFRLEAATPNPLFMRDPNALAGDNGTPQQVPGNVHEIYHSGFPILYDAKSTDVNFSGHTQVGGGVGVRFGDTERRLGLDVLAWYFRRELADAAPIHGSYYQGDLDLLRGAFGISLPLSGRDKVERGVNLQARAGGLKVFAQGISQEIAGLKRSGVEVEFAYRFPLPGLFASGDSPVVNWIQPAIRFSSINNDFSAPAGYVAPSFAWDWRKIDAGVRVGIVRGVDFTMEYAHHDVILGDGTRLHPDEALMTLYFALTPTT